MRWKEKIALSDFRDPSFFRIPCLMLLFYGFVVFADEGAGELFARGNSLFSSPLIWGSGWGWPGSGVAATEGLFVSLLGFLLLSFMSEESGPQGDIDFITTFARSLFDTSIVFFGWSLTWTILVSYYEPYAMQGQVTEFLARTGVTNDFVMYSSVVMLAVLLVIKLRHTILGSLPSVPDSENYILGFGILSVFLGVMLFLLDLYYSNPFAIMKVVNGYFFCDGVCYLKFLGSLVGGAGAAVLMLIGGIVTVEQMFPRKLESA